MGGEVLSGAGGNVGDNGADGDFVSSSTVGLYVGLKLGESDGDGEGLDVGMADTVGDELGQ